jgi:hypothetical protein
MWAVLNRVAHNNRLQQTAYGAGMQSEFPLPGSSQAEESPAKNGGG